MSSCGISSKPSMLGKSGINNLANLKRKKSKNSFIFSCTLISFILLLMSLTSCKTLLMLSWIGKFNTDAGEMTQSPVSVVLNYINLTKVDNYHHQLPRHQKYRTKDNLLWLRGIWLASTFWNDLSIEL